VYALQLTLAGLQTIVEAKHSVGLASQLMLAPLQIKVEATQTEAGASQSAPDALQNIFSIKQKPLQASHYFIK